MSAKRKVLENSFLYTFSQMLVKAMGFLLLPLYTLYLSPEDYGIVNLANSFLQVSIFIVAFSLNSGIVRFYVDYKENPNKLRRFLGTVILFVSIASIIFTLLGFGFNNLLISLFFKDISFFPYVFIVLLTISFLTIHDIHQKIIQAMQQGRKLTLINLSVFFLKVILNVIFIVILKLGAVGMLLAQLIVHIGYIFFMVYDLKKNRLFSFCIDLRMLWDALKYSIPLLPHNLSTRIASFASRVFMNIGHSIATVGLYSISFQFGTVIDTVQSSVNRAFRPWFFEMMKNEDEESKKEVLTLSSLLLTLYSFVYVVIGLFSQEAILIMTTKNYVMAWTAVPILVIAFSVKSIYYFYVNILFYYKTAARRIFISTLAGSFSDIILAFLLIPILGMYGAALAFLLAKLIVVTIVIFMARKYNNIGYRLKTMIKIIFPSIIFMMIGLFFSYTKYMTVFSWYNLFYKIFILSMYILFIYITNKQTINQFISTWKYKEIFKHN